MNSKTALHSTDQYDREQFKAHGRVDMCLKGSTIHVEAQGPFNEELMTALASLEAQFLASVAAQGPFAEIVVFHKSVLASPEVMVAHAQLLVMLKTAGFAHKASAYVIPDELDGAMFTGPIAIKNYAAVEWPFRICQTLEDAQAWIASVPLS